MKIQESAENYLETILILSKDGNLVRSIDIAKELTFTKPSVSVAMKNLKEDGYILIDSKGFISLSTKGYEIAKDVYEKHLLFSNWLINLGVDKKTAQSDACKMEHTMSAKSFKAIKKFIEKSNL